MNFKKLAIVGCGIVGAMLAYELKRQIPQLQIEVFEQQDRAAQGSTAAALGVLMGVISQKKPKSRAWKLRSASIQRYDRLIPELEERTGRTIPYNRNGILLLYTAQDAQTEHGLAKWQEVAKWREQEGLRLEILDRDQVQTRFPTVCVPPTMITAVYSPDDRQVDPSALTEALIAAAQGAGVVFHWNQPITQLHSEPDGLVHLATPSQHATFDRVIITAGTGSAAIAQQCGEPLQLANVLGQALHLAPPLNSPRATNLDPQTIALNVARSAAGHVTSVNAEAQTTLTDSAKYASYSSERVTFEQGNRLLDSNLERVTFEQRNCGCKAETEAITEDITENFSGSLSEPVITCDDVHIVPRLDGSFWVGATVEFDENSSLIQETTRLSTTIALIEQSSMMKAQLPPKLADLRQFAQQFYPGLAACEVRSYWQGYRPRPVNRSAPVIQPLADQPQIWLATGHYRNGVLLAPATAALVIEALRSAG